VQITVAITATDSTNLDTVTGDLVANIVYNGTVVASQDTLGSPEVVTYTAPDSTTPSGLTNMYAAQACNFNASDGPINYVGQYATNPSTEPPGGGDNSVFPFPPQWRVFPANPNFVGTGANPQPDSTDTRELWCWRNEDFGGRPVAGCDRELENLAARQPWDLEPRGTAPTFTTAGNQAISGEAWLSPLTPAEQYRPFDLQREYDFPWTNRWFEERCSPTAFAPRVEPGSPLGSNRNDIDAATANLFAMHNRMHDWSYFLGFTERNYNLQANNFGNTSTSRENDPEIGNSQAGALTGGQPTFLGRDNANQITLNDGIAPITNMYLWQPIAAAFYAPCVDGDYDMSVIGHEYTHAISNRMVAGPDAGLSGPQAGAVGESWSDLAAVEYLNGYGFVPVQNENPFAVGPYVTGDQQAGIRNYGMNASPLNYSDIGYDITGPQVHADGEIWSATNYSIRQRLIAKYNAQFPAGNAGLQERCADGELPADQCPGNRRWIQIMFDAFLLQPSTTSMVTARDAYLAADVMRFGGANQVELWDEFARRGLGESAASNTNADPDPRPSFSSPVATNEATVTFAPREATTAGQPVPNVSLYVGRYEARATPIADNDSSTTLGNSFQLVPGTYEFVARARGYGLTRLRATVTAGQQLTLSPRLARNVASFFSGATTGGDGVNQGFLIDDTEGTNWASLQPRGTAPVNQTQPQVTVDLAGTNAHTVRRVNVSAMLTLRNNQCSPENPQCDPQDTGSQNRFSALRQFQILTCNAAAGQTCNPNGTGGFQVVYTSPANAFPAIAPRPRAPELIFRTFNVPDTPATHVQLRVVHNQCTGGPDYQGDQDGDPGNNSDCVTGGSAAGLMGLGQGTNVRAAELQVFTNRLRVSGLP
ncbi:MAG: M36 family metallopeptidase, partial [Egibacteraceae bacterium]